ncbi:DUF6531 domain-containing protein, partial [Streptomyces sp. NPDC005866]
GGKGITSLGKIAKGLKEMKNLRGGMKAMSLAVKGLGKNARGMLADGAEGAFNRLKSAVRSKGSDPVDMATGAMYLPQTDIELPGILPLAFTRRVASDYRCGWWFGPGWASTLDQRLEIDAQGVVYVTEDGLLLSYPHPAAPHTPVLPEAGPRWPLTRQDDGGYRITDPLTGHTHHFARPTTEGTALLTGITDRNQHTLTFDHDEHGTPLAIRHSGGYHLRITTDEGRVTALSLAGAADDGSDIVIKRYGYTDGNLTETVNSSGLPLRFTYDDRLRVTSWTDTNNSRYAYTYDDRDRCIAEGGQAGHITITLDYDTTDPAWPDCHITTLTTAEGATTRFVINTNSQVIAEMDPLGGVTRTEYDERHQLLSWTDALGRATRLTNNEYNQPVRIARPDGHETRAEYNELLLPVTVTGPDGLTHRQTYDDRGNRTSVTDPTDNTTRFTYDGQGRLTSIVDPLGGVTGILCDSAGLPLSITDPSGAVTSCARDTFGRPTVITDASGAVTRLGWTVEGRLAERIAPDGSVEAWEFDGEGNRTAHIDRTGAVSRYEYTHFDLLAARTGPDGARYDFTYDAGLRLTTVTNPQGLRWSYTYDAAGRLVSEKDFDDRVLTYTHDVAGRLCSRTDSLGQTVHYERDVLGRVTRKDAHGQVTTFVYDAVGELAEAAGPDATLVLRRDPLGRLVSESVNGRAVVHSHDEVGRRTRRATPAGALSAWSYDEVGRPARLTSSGRSIDFGYDEVGRETSRRIGSVLTLAHTFDASGRLTLQSIRGGDGESVQRRSYSYRADGALAGIDDQLAGPQRFDLDPLGRVTAVHASNWSESYAYDQAGNQTYAAWPASHPGHEATGERAYSGTRITHAGRVRYEHDALGRVTLRQRTRLSRKPDTWRYTWDAEDRLTAVRTPDGTLWRYAYDPLGRRIAKMRMDADGERAVERTDFTWDGTTLCEQTTLSDDLPHLVTLTWDYQGRRPVSQSERITERPTGQSPQGDIDLRFFAIVTDLIGAPRELVDEAGEIAWRTRSTVWGSTVWAAGSTAYTPLRFPGQYFDPETGLHYNYFRHYDPESARYLSPDPLGLEPAPNPLTYVPTPHTRSDSLGLAPDYHEFFTVQDAENARRLRGDGTPWPTAENRGHYGEGVYSWESRADAQRYAERLRGRGAEVEVMPFRVSASDFDNMKRIDLHEIGEDAATEFADKHSRLWGDGLPHEYDYVRAPTGMGQAENIFSKSVFHLLKF